MTREEKEQTGKYVLKMARLLEDGCWQQKMLLNAVHIIDEVLELESILDKIKEDVVQTRKMYLDMNDIDWLNGCDYVLSVVDKYRSRETRGKR